MDQNSLDILFQEAVVENAPVVPKTTAEKVISMSEEEFKGYSAEERSRQDEMQEITAKLKDLYSQLRKCGNIKNPRLRKLNAGRSEKRKRYKIKIAECNLRLKEIGEERGSEK